MYKVWFPCNLSEHTDNFKTVTTNVCLLSSKSSRCAAGKLKCPLVLCFCAGSALPLPPAKNTSLLASPRMAGDVNYLEAKIFFPMILLFSLLLTYIYIYIKMITLLSACCGPGPCIKYSICFISLDIYKSLFSKKYILLKYG